MQFVYWAILSIHVLASAAWFGAMFYSLMVLHPRARAFFSDAKRFEEFIAYIANGARWKVLGGAACIAVTGVALMFFSSEEHRSAAWKICVALKTIFISIAIGIFCFASWKLWPARIMCMPEEIPKFQKQFRLVAVTLLVLIGAAMVLGVVSVHL